MAPDQEWCLACGAAASTEVAEPRGWRVPIMLTGGLVALGVIGIILAIVALSGGPEKVAQATPTPSAAAGAPPPATPTPPAAVTPLPTPTASPTESTTPAPSATATDTATPEPSTTPDNTSSGSGDTSSQFSDWPGGNGFTVIIESAKTLSKAERVATSAQGKGHTVGILHSDDYSSLNPGYYVVFTEKYSSESAAESGLHDIKSDYPDAYVRHVTP
jgi:hypothetical protein